MHLIIPNLLIQINKYSVIPSWKIIKCIDKKRLQSDKLCSNINAIKYIKKFIGSFYTMKTMIEINEFYPGDLYDFICWHSIARNKNAINCLKREIKLAEIEKRNVYFVNYIPFSNIIKNKSKFRNRMLIPVCKLSKNNPEKNTWYRISGNSKLIKLLKQEITETSDNIDSCKIDFSALSGNSGAIEIINYEIKLADIQNRNCRIDYEFLLDNPNPEILNMLKPPINKIKWICQYGTKFDILDIYNNNEARYNLLSCNKNIFEVDKNNYKKNLLILSDIL